MQKYYFPQHNGMNIQSHYKSVSLFKIFIVLNRIISQLVLLLLVFIINRLTHQCIFNHFPGTLLSCS